MIKGLSGLERVRWGMTGLGKTLVVDGGPDGLGEAELSLLKYLHHNGPEAGLYLGVNSRMCREDLNFSLSKLYYKKYIKEEGEGLDEVCKN